MIFWKRLNIALLILWIGVLNEAFMLNMEKKPITKSADSDVVEQEPGFSEDAVDGTEMITHSELLEKEPEMIRVLLMNSEYESYYHPYVTVQYDGTEETYHVESDVFKNGNVVIECDGEGIAITSIQRQQGTPVYQGKLEIRKTEEGLLLVNELPVEKYLEAVVPSEMPSSYHQEALKAQAVCARTYAYKQMEKKRLKEYDADVDDSVRYQVYGNIARQESTNEAVKETRGQVLYQGEELIEAYYFSTSSGWTSTNEVWGAQEAASYLKSVECTFDKDEPWSRWTVQIPWENLEMGLAALLEKEGKEVNADNRKLLNIQIERMNQSGAIIGMRLVTKKESYEVAGEYDVRAFFSPNGCEITGKDGRILTGGSLLPSAYFDIEISNGEYVKIYGRGYGHGVGMSQNAADEMAKQGYTWEEILKYFFKDVEIRTY